MKFFVRDRKKNVLWEGDDHIRARHAYRDINLAHEAKAYEIVDEKGVQYGRRTHAPGNTDPVGARAWAIFALPERLVMLIREHARTSDQSVNRMVEKALSKRREPTGAIAREKTVPFRVSIPLIVRAHLERVAMEQSTTITAIGELALRALCEDLEAKRAA
jgi:hypothetical protein